MENDLVKMVGNPDVNVMNALRESARQQVIAGEVPVLSGVTFQTVGNECSIEEGVKIIHDTCGAMKEAEVPIVYDEVTETPIGNIKNSWRNKPCRCGSHVKYKHCHLASDMIANHQLKLQETRK